MHSCRVTIRIARGLVRFRWGLATGCKLGHVRVAGREPALLVHIICTLPISFYVKYHLSDSSPP